MQNDDTSNATINQDAASATCGSSCHILGVYSHSKNAETGQGVTSRSYAQKTLWFVRRLDDDTYCIQALNANSIPSGPLTHISKGEFIRNYHPEPGYYEKRCLPFIESLKKKIALAEKHLAEEDLDGAEKEFCKALLLDEKHPKANIELGKIYLQQGNGKKLAVALRRILGIDALFQAQERHLFNEFGICLRKEKHFTEAVNYYGKALEQSADDEHLHFNMARAKAEAGDQDGARAHLDQALALRPDFAEAKRFRAFLDQAGPDEHAPLPDRNVPEAPQS